MDEKTIWEVRHLDTNDADGKLVPACLVFESIDYTDLEGQVHNIRCCRCRATIIDKEKGHLSILYATLVKALKLDHLTLHSQCDAICEYIVELVMSHKFKWIRLYHFALLEDYAALRIEKIAKDREYDLEYLRKVIKFKN